MTLLGGNLSSNPASSVGVRYENVINVAGKLSPKAKGFVEQLCFDLALNVYIITTGDERKVKAFCMKRAIPYTNVIAAESTLEIPFICMDHKFVAYYDVDDRVLDSIGARGEPRTQGFKWESR